MPYFHLLLICEEIFFFLKIVIWLAAKQFIGTIKKCLELLTSWLMVMSGDLQCFPLITVSQLISMISIGFLMMKFHTHTSNLSNQNTLYIGYSAVIGCFWMWGHTMYSKGFMPESPGLHCTIKFKSQLNL